MHKNEKKKSTETLIKKERRIRKVPGCVNRNSTRMPFIDFFLRDYWNQMYFVCFSLNALGFIVFYLFLKLISLKWEPMMWWWSKKKTKKNVKKDFKLFFMYLISFWKLILFIFQNNDLDDITKFFFFKQNKINKNPKEVNYK